MSTTVSHHCAHRCTTRINKALEVSLEENQSLSDRPLWNDGGQLHLLNSLDAFGLISRNGAKNSPNGYMKPAQKNGTSPAQICLDESGGLFAFKPLDSNANLGVGMLIDEQWLNEVDTSPSSSLSGDRHATSVATESADSRQKRNPCSKCGEFFRKMLNSTKYNQITSGAATDSTRTNPRQIRNPFAKYRVLVRQMLNRELSVKVVKDEFTVGHRPSMGFRLKLELKRALQLYGEIRLWMSLKPIKELLKLKAIFDVEIKKLQNLNSMADALIQMQPVEYRPIYLDCDTENTKWNEKANSINILMVECLLESIIQETLGDMTMRSRFYRKHVLKGQQSHSNESRRFFLVLAVLAVIMFSVIYLVFATSSDEDVKASPNYAL